MLLGRREHDDFALRINRLGHLVTLLWRVPEQLADHAFNVFIGVSVAIPKDDMVPRYFALFALVLLLRLGNHRGRLLLVGDDGFFGVHAAPVKTFSAGVAHQSART